VRKYNSVVTLAVPEAPIAFEAPAIETGNLNDAERSAADAKTAFGS
jgi:hypothetical protein